MNKFEAMFVAVALAFCSVCTLPVQAQTRAALVQNVDNPDRTPYQNSTYFTIDPPYVNNFGYFATPSGSRYFIEFVSLSCVTPSAADSFPQVYLNVSRNVPSGTNGYAIPVLTMTRTGASPFGGYVWGATAMVKVFADPSPYETSGGSAIYFNVFHSDTSVKPSCNATVTGHSLPN
ncbi:MAG: hypothetical protein K2Y02_08275 [Burkholderiaceae bacterium]|nr:hypothetical protein [Burkholderiaceae bacterium]